MMADTRVKATITRTVIVTDDQARERGFSGSTTLLDGSDPFAEHRATVPLSCRLDRTVEGPRGVPTLPDLRQALKRERARLSTSG
ncbi:MAG TPA: hypothetical protein VFX33_05105 [Actinomycetales bacterium]|nr:hypothetical protein [Actinomycetales bacterium]